MQVIQIVPRLPPSVDGVGDYALLLAKQLRAVHGIKTQFVVCDPGWKNVESGKAENRNEQGAWSRKPGAKSDERLDQLSVVRGPVVTLDGFPVHQLRERSAEELFRTLNQPGMPDTALLQYVGYGYQQRGCPVWLTRALRAWKKTPSSHVPDPNSRRLITMFHEVSADGPIWRSAFWMSRLQQWVAKSLAQTSTHCFTNLNLHARSLQNLTARSESDFTVLPVFSNIGEPPTLPDWSTRAPRMIVFGSSGWRQEVYGKYKGELAAACRDLGLEEIVDIGAPVELPPMNIKVTQRGILSALEVSMEMANARAGFFSCPTHCLGKSGIFAAYAAHGLVAVTFGKNQKHNLDGLVFGRHFVTAEFWSNPSAHQIEDVGRNIFDWYQRHSLSKQADCFNAIGSKN